jgi:hypothetical protein
VLTRIFVGLWSKQKTDVPDTDLKKLAKAFDTPEDPILLMKGCSMKRGAEGAISLTYADGEEVNWEKVSSSRGRPLSELRVFFEKAKKYAPGIVSIIFSFGGFFDLCYAGFFDSGDKWIHASSQRWCYLCRAYFCHGA